MNRRDFGAKTLYVAGVSGLLLVPGLGAAARLRLPRFEANTTYRLRTAILIDRDQEWARDQVMRISDGDAVLWSWDINQYNEDDPAHIEVNRSTPYEYCYSGWRLAPRRWHSFEWRLRFSDTDGLLEGWMDDRKILAIRGPTCEFGASELAYEEATNPAIHFSRVTWDLS